jgi:hypothetical protein
MSATPKPKNPAPATVAAHATGKWAETMFRALSTRVAKRWQFLSFRGAKKGEWKGAVDLVAIRKNTAKPDSKTLKRGDLFDIILVQVKGGSAKAPTVEDKRRLQEVADYYHATKVVQFCWQKGKKAEFSVLQTDALTWKICTGAEIFG